MLMEEQEAELKKINQEILEEAGGGYPGAGIGGGGAGGGGGTDDCGAGGYTGGAGEAYRGVSNNGDGGNGTSWYGGGGYFSSGKKNNVAIIDSYAYIGGEGWYCGTEHAGNGGIAGTGGNIKISENGRLYAYNGNKYTDGTNYNNGDNQLIIYAQSGILRNVYIQMLFFNTAYNRNYNYYSKYITSGLLLTSSDVASGTNRLIRKESSCEKTNYINIANNSVQGVGSGAGYIEISNGTYTIDASMN